MKILITLLLFISCTVFASENTIDEYAETLPKGFKGSSFKDVWTKLALIKQPNKDEYESTAQYDARLSAWNEKQKNKVPGTLWFFIPRVNGNNFDIDYDANLERFKITIRPLENYKNIAENREFLINMTKKNLGAYTATNGFGAKFKVQKAFTDSDALILYGYSKTQETVLEVESPLAKTKTVKDDIALLLYGSIYSPYANGTRDHISPDANFLYDATTIDRYIYIKPGGVWIVNKKTGEIFSKHDWSQIQEVVTND